MSIHSELRETLKTALKAHDEATLRTVRGIITACTNELVATNRTPQDKLSDEEVLKVIKRLAKQRKDSITQYAAANRMDLVDIEKVELEILETYLPKTLSLEELKPIAEKIKADLSVTDKSKIGILIGTIMKETKGQADGADVKKVAEDLF